MNDRRLALVGVLFLLAGCAGLGAPATSTVWLGLAPPLPPGGVNPSGPSVLVPSFTTAEPFQTTRIATLEGPSRWRYSYYHRWVAEPGEMVAYHLREHLLRSGRFAAVLAAPGPFDPDFRLGGAVHAIYWDRQKKEAVVEVEISLARNPNRFAGFWVYRSRSPLEGEGSEAFVRAASKAVSEIFRRAVQDLGKATLAPKPSRSEGPLS